MADTSKDGGPAFPLAATPESIDYHGMSLRDWFAGQALAGYFACSHTPHQNAAGRDEAEYMYRMADAMIAAREASA